MPTIVEHIPSQKRYILLGAGYGQWASARPNRMLGDLFAVEQTGSARLVCLCDEYGKVEWAYDDKVRVISVDGDEPSRILGNR